MQVDCDFPGGNILVDRIEGDMIEVHQDLRDTTQDWFYWYFRVRGAAGRTLQVHFTDSNPIGVRGPAASLDGGYTWRWLGMECVQGQSFTFQAPQPGGDEVRFSFGMPYVQDNLDRFLAQYSPDSGLRRDVLCTSRKGRPVELLQLGRPTDQAPFHVLLTCRHHCCEMMANYSLEGIIEFVLENTPHGEWLRENVAFLIVPFMDKDGVEEGDQGKLRAPYDHNRDYAGESIYPEVANLRRLVPEWCGLQAGWGKLDIALDMHCPWIRGGINETIFLVGEADARLWEQTNAFGAILEARRRGPIRFECKNNLPFGVDWNTGSELGRRSFSEWARESFPGLRLCNTLEIAYANASGAEVNVESARLLGADLAQAIAVYLIKSCK